MNADAWRVALRVFEHAFGRPREEPEQPPIVDDDFDLRSMSWNDDSG